MASTSKIVKSQRKPKFSTRLNRRCLSCGRPRAVYRKFGLCRICFRKMAERWADSRCPQGELVKGTANYDD